MFQFRLVCVSKIKQGAFQELTDHYIHLLSSLAKVSVSLVEPVGFRDVADRERVLLMEAERIESVLSSEATVVFLHATPRTDSSVDFAKRLATWSEQETRPLQFVIGGPLGLHPSLLRKYPNHLSLSPLTMPHDLARVVLLEQLYRAMTILTQKIYHY